MLRSLGDNESKEQPRARSRLLHDWREDIWQGFPFTSSYLLPVSCLGANELHLKWKRTRITYLFYYIIFFSSSFWSMVYPFPTFWFHLYSWRNLRDYYPFLPCVSQYLSGSRKRIDCWSPDGHHFFLKYCLVIDFLSVLALVHHQSRDQRQS